MTFASFVSVPEASIHEDARMVFAQYDVWVSRQPRVIHPVPEPPAPQEFPHHHLRLRIPAPNGRHILVPLLYRQILYFKWNLILSKQMPTTYLHLVICQIMNLNP